MTQTTQNMIKIDEYTSRQYGERGIQVSVPSIFIKDNEIKAGDTLAFYRTFLESGVDALVIIPKKDVEKINPAA